MPQATGGYTPNPYLSQMAGDMQRRSGESLNLGLQNIRGNAVGVGGLGGSRQGVAEGMAISGANDSLQGNLSNLFGTDYTNSQGRDLQRYGVDTNAALTRSGQSLQRYGMDQNADLTRGSQGLQKYGMDQSFMTANRGLDNQRTSADQNFYTNQRGQDQSGMRLGADLFNAGNNGFLNQGQGVYGLGNTEQQAPWSVINSANSVYRPYAGAGASETRSESMGGGASGMLGGALGGYQIGKNLGLGGGSYGSEPYPGYFSQIGLK